MGRAVGAYKYEELLSAVQQHSNTDNQCIVLSSQLTEIFITSTNFIDERTDLSLQLTNLVPKLVDDEFGRKPCRDGGARNVGGWSTWITEGDSVESRSIGIVKARPRYSNGSGQCNTVGTRYRMNSPQKSHPNGNLAHL